MFDGDIVRLKLDSYQLTNEEKRRLFEHDRSLMKWGVKTYRAKLIAHLKSLDPQTNLQTVIKMLEAGGSNMELENK